MHADARPGPSAPPRYHSVVFSHDAEEDGKLDSRPPTGPPSTEPADRPPLALARRRATLVDQVLPVPSSDTMSSPTDSIPFPVLRRTAAVAVISIFILSTLFLAATAGQHAHAGLGKLFSVGSAVHLGAQWAAFKNVPASSSKEADFAKYKSLKTLSSSETDVTKPGKRIIFIGDVHGSYSPLERLLDKLDYDDGNDRVIHVGDLVAKGQHHVQVLDWMRRHRVQGVRGNHDQPVIQWRSWMEWAGGRDWESWVDSLASGDDHGVVRALAKSNKRFPVEWEWKGEHWHIARQISSTLYEYLVDLPLVLHMPELHAFVVHAGLLPHDPRKSASAKSQPLVKAAASRSSDTEAMRFAEELSVLDDIEQNTEPYTLINIRSVFLDGDQRGQVTKSSRRGEPWSNVWTEQMQRCTVGRDKRNKGDKQPLACAPFTLVYGHAAGRGLDIKSYSKGIDTGCVYGRRLTALVLGDTSGLEGDKVQVGGHQGVLVSVDCKEGGL